ncbi:hypothetical protein SPAN111604_13730 [Sphingomonas antarctica]|uniref:glycosyltransferase n=1 Tax=Sphingomonas antarctica TaxID=2040274 RepID=UPI0039E9B41B
MANVLIGWELGGGRGHLVSMKLIAEALIERGHRVTIAAQRTDVPLTMPPGVAMFQAPIWPGLLSTVGAGDGRVSTIVDVLARLGLGRRGVLAGMISAWEALIALSRADLVIADYAPALLVAARGRLPSVSVGPGFQVAPSDTDPIARLGGGSPGHNEGNLLDTVDAELRAAGRKPLPHLAALFATDAPLIGSFPELDPYHRNDQTGRFIAPGLDGVPQLGAGQGDEVFVYANNPIQANKPFWQAVVATRLPIRAHIPGIDTSLRVAIAAMGVTVEPRPVPIDRIVARSRLCINHGAHGIICAMMLGGVPQLMLPLDLEKGLHSAAVAHAGLGVLPPIDENTVANLPAILRAAYHDAELVQRVREATPGFHARMTVPYGPAVAEAAAALL